MSKPNKYDYVNINTLQKDHMDFVTMAVKVLDEAIQESCPDSREKSLALTKLEECCYFSKKSISHNPDQFIVPEVEAEEWEDD